MGKAFWIFGLCSGLMMLVAARSTAETAAETAAISLVATQEEGLFAEINTNKGAFRCRLFYKQTPQTVANFIGLAEGSKVWLDERSGDLRTRSFYQGLLFHRVDRQVQVIQAGSPSGDGRGGPGYTFRDEFDSQLRHSKAGVLSMANSGLNSNGSQFFITLTATSSFDDLHSVFGEVVEEDLDVIATLGGVAVDDNNKPIEDVAIERIVIDRVGADANAFNSSAEARGLPVVSFVQAGFEFVESRATLLFQQSGNAEHWMSFSGDLRSWSNNPLGLFIGQARDLLVDVTPTTQGMDQQFYRIVKVQYPELLLTPASIRGWIVRLSLPKGILNMGFTDPDTGIFLLQNNDGGDAGGNILSYIWDREAYRAVLFVNHDSLSDIQVSLDFRNATAGVYGGRIIGGGRISGNFVIDPLNE